MQALSADRSLRGQLALFRPPQSPANVDVHAVSIPARNFTGDFYFTRRHGERLWFALGDVAGKGLNAAVIMAMIQEELEHRIASCARTGCDPAATMTPVAKAPSRDSLSQLSLMAAGALTPVATTPTVAPTATTGAPSKPAPPRVPPH